MHGDSGCGPGNFLPRTIGAVSWCILEIEVDTSKPLPMLAIAEISFDIRQSKHTKELRIIPYPGRQSKKTLDAGRRPNNENQAFMV
jgi:hypothetical protein